MLKIDKDDIMLCPVCGFEYTHLLDVKTYKEKDNRLCVRLTFECEFGHRFYVDIHQHEGFTLINNKTYNYETDHDVML